MPPVTSQKIPVPLETLLTILGASTRISDMKAINAPAVIERVWSCGCVAIHNAQKENIALWAACLVHANVFFDRHAARTMAGATVRKRGYTVRWSWRLSFAPVMIASAALVVVEVVALLLKRAERAESEAIVDPLTGLYNRRGWDRRSTEEYKRAGRTGEGAMTVFMMDVDNLKGINDRDGHAAGDMALACVANVIRSVTREHDVAARFGGDEFAILAIHPKGSDAETISARLRDELLAQGLSVSIGSVPVSVDGTIDAAMLQADREMYARKMHHRNATALA